MTSAMIWILVAVVVYLLGMLAIGFKYANNSTSEDFYLGGRKLGPIVTAMSTEASDMSAYLLMGVPGLAFFCGVAEAGWTAIGLALGTYLNWLIVAKRLRRYSAGINAITVPDFLARRFRDNTKLIETLGALTVIIFFVPYTASGFAACGKLFNSLFGFDYMTAMIISAAVIVIYCATGGFMAASVTSLIQGIVMTIALVIVLIFGINTAGGWDAVIANAKEIPGYLDFSASTSILTGTPSSYSPLMIASTLAWGLGYFGMPHILVRYLSIKSEHEMRKSQIIGCSWILVILAMSAVVGVIGRQFLGEIDNENLVFVHMVRRLFPAFISGVLLSAILAAAMSTADSQLLASSSAFASDIYKPVIRKDATDHEMQWAGRIIVILISVVAYFIAADPNCGGIMALVECAWAGFGSAFGPVILLSLYWRRLTYSGAVAGVCVGFAVDALWYAFLSTPTGLYEIIPGFLCGLIAAVVVSLCSKAPSKEVTDLFDRAFEPTD